MKRWGTGLAAAALALAVTPALAGDARDADDPSWYIKGQGGWSFSQSTEFDDSLSTDVELGDDFVIGAAVGYEFRRNWRAELEATYESKDTDDAANPALRGGELTTTAFMANIYRDFDIGHRIKPFIGAGIGVAGTDPDFQVLSPGGPYRPDGTDYGFAWQVSAGVSMDFTDRLTGEIRYRYMDAGDYELQGTGGTIEGDNKSHAVLAGLRFSLGGGRYEPAPEPVAQASSTPVEIEDEPAPPIMRETVYFPFDETTITTDAARVLDRVADATVRRDTQRLTIEGHTDRAGPATYNMRLSRKRAMAVREALIARGIDAQKIVLVAKGESEPQANTDDGVRDQLNRRAEIVIEFD